MAKVIISVDASYCLRTGACGYAYKISCKKRRSLYWGQEGFFIVDSPLIAEIVAILEALRAGVDKRQVLPGDLVIIESDCMGAIATLQGKRKKLSEYEEKLLQSYRDFRHNNKVFVVLSHVSGHSVGRARHTVDNNECDRRAKIEMKKRRKKYLDDLERQIERR